jgi:glycosyltransferase involved in cell wall biosynthesis
VTESPTPPRRHLCILFHESVVLGAGLSLVRVLDLLKAHGWSISGWFPGPGPLLAESAATLDAQGEKEKPIASSLRGWRRPPGIASRMRDTPRYLRAFRAWLLDVRPHLVHANSRLVLPEATIARTFGLPVVFQMHELPPPGRKGDLTLRWAAAVADLLIGVSTPVAETLRRHAGSTPVTTVWNGVPLVQQPRDAHGSFTVGTVGYVSPTKGTDVFLHAAELALQARPTLRFEHVGDAGLWGDEEFDRGIEELAASPRLRLALTLLGRASVPDALARWDVFVLPSRQEAFPLSTLEAMAAGLPVIATAVGGVPEQIAHLETGILVAPENPAAIAEWILRLEGDAELRARLGTAAARHVRSHFTLARQAERLNDAYEMVLRRRATQRALRGTRAARTSKE